MTFSSVWRGARPPARGTRLDLIRSEGRIRVGFDPDTIPWAFLNGSGIPVGYDAEIAHQLALALGVRLEHVALNRERFSEALASGAIDVVMSGHRVSARAAEQQVFSRPYDEEEIAFLTLDHRRTEFEQWEALRGRRVSIGPEGSGGRALALNLAKRTKVDTIVSEFLDLPPGAAAEKLIAGEIDAAFIVPGWDSPVC